jgi:hypothetical protein
MECYRGLGTQQGILSVGDTYLDVQPFYDLDSMELKTTREATTR